MLPIMRSVAGRKLTLRRDDVCTCCGADLAAGTHSWWDKDRRTVTCTGCWVGANSSPGPVAAPPDLGQPGASLLREHERRRRNRENRTRGTHPRIGGLVLALGGAPQHESAFEQGALAERAVADSLARRTNSDRVITLHNRRMPGGRGDIDHVAVAPTGVWVIDTKDWKGKVEIKDPLFGTPAYSSAAASAPASSTDSNARSPLSARHWIVAATIRSRSTAPSASPRLTSHFCGRRHSARTFSSIARR